MKDLSMVPTSARNGIECLEIDYIAPRNKGGLFHVQCPVCHDWIRGGQRMTFILHCYKCFVNITVHDPKIRKLHESLR